MLGMPEGFWRVATIINLWPSLSESGVRSGSCWLFQNLTSWPWCKQRSEGCTRKYFVVCQILKHDTHR